MKSNFLWGNSVSSMQTEGAWNIEGKGMSVYDKKEIPAGLSNWKDGIDSYHRFDEDISLMSKIGMNCYRFSISWSRVDPNGDGNFNQAGIDYYDRVIDDLLNHQIKPMICLYHFDLPFALAKKYNGFVAREVEAAFVRFGKKIIDTFGSKVKLWLTFNEQNGFMFEPGFENSGYLNGNRSLLELYTISHHTLLAHAELSKYLHQNFPSAKIGGMVAYQAIYPTSSKPTDVFAAQQAEIFINDQMLHVFTQGSYHPQVLQYLKRHKLTSFIQSTDFEMLANTHNDFIAFSYYASTMIAAASIPEGTPPNYYLQYGEKPNPYLERTAWDWQIDPLGFRMVLTRLSNQYQLPIFPIENGIGVNESNQNGQEIQDDYRIEYHRNHLQALKQAVEQDGVDVPGYLGWGLIDILSSKGDMNKRYGMVYVNRTNTDLRDLKRVPKKSYYWFQKVIASNGEYLDKEI